MQHAADLCDKLEWVPRVDLWGRNFYLDLRNITILKGFPVLCRKRIGVMSNVQSSNVGGIWNGWVTGSPIQESFRTFLLWSPLSTFRASITPLISSVRIFRQALGVFDFMASCRSSRGSNTSSEPRNVKTSGNLLNSITAFALGNKQTESFSRMF